MSEADELTVVVLAAGGGTRMKSKTMKVLHHIGGRSMIGHVLTAVRSVEPHRVVAVVGHQREQVGRAHPGAGARRRARGAGGARRHRRRRTGGHGGQRYDDGARSWWPPATRPLLEGESLRRFVADHRAAEQVVSILSGVVPNPFGYGRILRNHEGDVEAIVEEKDATPDQRDISEISSGILAFDAEFLVGALGRLTNDNAKGEFYLTDTVKIAREDGLTVGAFAIDDVMQTEGANDRVQLAEMGRELNRRIVTRWMLDGVTVMDPATTWIDADVKLAADVTILPGVQLLGATVVAEDAVIGPDTTLKDCEVGAGARVVRAHAELAVIGDRASVGPFAYLRPGTVLDAEGKIGTFVETKNAQIARRRQGAPPVLRRRRRDRREGQHRGRHDLRQLRRGRQAPHDRGPVVPRRLQQHLRRPRRDRRRRLDRRRDRRTPQRAARCPRGFRWPAAQPGRLGDRASGPGRRRPRQPDKRPARRTRPPGRASDGEGEGD